MAKGGVMSNSICTCNRKTFKQTILDICSETNDVFASEERFRIEGAISDIHAAYARYHVDCMTNFMAPKSAASAIDNQRNGLETQVKSLMLLMLHP